MEALANILEYIWYKLKLFMAKMCVVVLEILPIFFIIILLMMLDDNINKMFCIQMLLVCIIVSIIAGLFVVPSLLLAKDMFVTTTNDIGLRMIYALLLKVEREHALWLGRKYLFPYKKTCLILQNTLTTVILHNKTVICKDNHDQNTELKTSLKPFVIDGPKLPQMAYDDIWNQICKIFNEKTTAQDIADLFRINKENRVYSIFHDSCESYREYKKEINKRQKLENIINYVEYQKNNTDDKTVIDGDDKEISPLDDSERQVDL